MLIWYTFNVIIHIFRFASGDWISLTEPTSATLGSLKMTVDLNQRIDTGSINHSPVSEMAPSVMNLCMGLDYYIPGKKKKSVCSNMRYLIPFIHYFL